MMADIRNADGRFPKGTSGNRRGRPQKRVLDPKLPAARRDVIMRVADRIVDVKVDIQGTIERMSLYEANVYKLAVAGAQGNRVSAQKFIELAMETSERDIMMRVRNRMLIDRMNQVEDELYELQKKTGAQSGVLHVSMEEWEAMNERRFDDRSAKEILGHHRPGEGGKK